MFEHLLESVGALRWFNIASATWLRWIFVLFEAAYKKIAFLRPLQKGLFLPPALFANAHLLLNKLRFAA